MTHAHSRVLIADPDRRLRTQLDTRLLDLEVFSDSAATANEALELLRDRNYGLILLDLEMPNDEAYSLLDAVRRLPRAEQPMMVATASARAKPNVDPELVQIILRKPLRLADVAEIIRSCVGSARDAVAGSDKRVDGSIELIGGNEQVVGVVR